MPSIKTTHRPWEKSHKRLEALPAMADPTSSADISRPIGKADIKKIPSANPATAINMKSVPAAKKKSIKAATAKSTIIKGFLRMVLSEIPGITIDPIICSANPDMYLCVAEQETSGPCLDWVKNNIFKESTEDVYGLFDQMAANVEPGSCV